MLYDRRTDSVWYPLDDTALHAVGGELKGAAIPFVDEPSPLPLSAWIAEHPGTTVLLPTVEDYKMIHRPYLGVSLADDETGVLVRSVRPESPAEAAGFAEGDRLVRLGRYTVTKRRDLREILPEYKAGQRIKALVLRDGRKTVLRVELAPRPES